MKNIITCLVLICFVASSNAQEIGYGFKAGLNFSTFQGPIASSPTIENLESFKNNTGFQIGGIVNFKFTDAFGIRTELLFSQKGGRYSYNGPAHLRLFKTNDEPFPTVGNQIVELNITNAYIDIPVMGYARINSWLEVSAGANIGFLISSSAAGELRYDGQTLGGVPIEEFVVNLDYRYFADEPQQAKLLDDEPISREIENQFISIPKGFGAYYNYDEGMDTGLFNIIDVGILGGINIYLNQGLSLGARFNYGLLDITNNNVDRNLAESTDSQVILSDDIDRNISLQASLTFSF